MPEPEYGTDGLFVWITFRRPTKNDNAGKTSQESKNESSDSGVAESVVEKLSERQILILEYLASSVVENVVETAYSLSQKLRVSHRSIQRDLSTLSAKGLIRRIGPDKGGHWEIINDEQ